VCSSDLYLVRTGVMEPETALNHPDRNCLTSVLAGNEVPRIDCPATPVQLMDGDIVIAASDGLQFLENPEIADILADCGAGTSGDISTELLHRLDQLDDPDQDNVSFCVIKAVRKAAAADVLQMVPAPSEQISPQPVLSAARTENEKVTIMASKTDTSLSLMYRISSGRGA